MVLENLRNLLCANEVPALLGSFRVSLVRAQHFELRGLDHAICERGGHENTAQALAGLVGDLHPARAVLNDPQLDPAGLPSTAGRHDSGLKGNSRDGSKFGSRSSRAPLLEACLP